MKKATKTSCIECHGRSFTCYRKAACSCSNLRVYRTVRYNGKSRLLFWVLVLIIKQLENRLKTGTFCRETKDQFMHILEYYGQAPYIIRSSSILEDGFDNAFAGKYESVFGANRGTPEERLEEFENAVRTVYASSAGLSALDFRKRRGLDRRDEQMDLIVLQRDTVT